MVPQTTTNDAVSHSDPLKQLPAPASADDAALALVRHKVDSALQKEPSALQEEQHIIAKGPQSKHQQFIQSLMTSGKDLVQIQTAWHEYYQALPDTEKHIVWNEFYETYPKKSATKPPTATLGSYNQTQPIPDQQKAHVPSPVFGEMPSSPNNTTNKTLADTKTELLNKVTARGKLKPKHHLQSLLFGLSMGFVAMAIVMFGFFNERFITPFITPSRSASASPIIINPNEQVGPETKVIIPKINVDVPVVYDVADNQEKTIQNALEYGVVHYPSTPVPGQNGNVVVVGHSSNNLLNTGKYKFAFVLLSRLQPGDTITMQYGGKRYVYKVYEKVIIKPTDVGVLGPTSKQASLTLITCDPPGTSVNRLVIHAEQISPAVDSNVASAPAPTTPQTTPAIVPGNAPSLFERLFGWL